MHNLATKIQFNRRPSEIVNVDMSAYLKSNKNFTFLEDAGSPRSIFNISRKPKICKAKALKKLKFVSDVKALKCKLVTS